MMGHINNIGRTPFIPPLHDEESQERQDSDPTDALLLAAAEVDFQEDLVRERAEGIASINREVHQVHGLFRDVAFHVTQQGEILEHIESNVNSTADRTQQANQQLSVAQERHGRSTKQNLLCIFMFLLLALILVAVLRIVASHAGTMNRVSVLGSQVTGRSSGGRFAGQVVVITGGCGGMGRAVAERLLDPWENAAKVIAVDCIDPGSSALKGISYYICDVTSEKSVMGTFMMIQRDFEKIDVLIQTAGITGETGALTENVSVADFDKVFSINSRGVFLCAKAVLPGMRMRKYGRIVNVASISGKDGNPNMLAYSASKAAVIGLTKVIGKEYCIVGDITVNAVAPAVVRTSLVEKLPESVVKMMTSKIPKGRCCGLDEVASVILFAASPEASFCTGFTFDASGGRAVY